MSFSVSVTNYNEKNTLEMEKLNIYIYLLVLCAQRWHQATSPQQGLRAERACVWDSSWTRHQDVFLWDLLSLVGFSRSSPSCSLSISSDLFLCSHDFNFPSVCVCVCLSVCVCVCVQLSVSIRSTAPVGPWAAPTGQTSIPAARSAPGTSRPRRATESRSWVWLNWCIHWVILCPCVEPCGTSLPHSKAWFCLWGHVVLESFRLPQGSLSPMFYIWNPNVNGGADVRVHTFGLTTSVCCSCISKRPWAMAICVFMFVCVCGKAAHTHTHTHTQGHVWACEHLCDDTDRCLLIFWFIF